MKHTFLIGGAARRGVSPENVIRRNILTETSSFCEYIWIFLIQYKMNNINCLNLFLLYYIMVLHFPTESQTNKTMLLPRSLPVCHIPFLFLSIKPYSSRILLRGVQYIRKYLLELVESRNKLLRISTNYFLLDYRTKMSRLDSAWPGNLPAVTSRTAVRPRPLVRLPSHIRSARLVQWLSLSQPTRHRTVYITCSHPLWHYFVLQRSPLNKHYTFNKSIGSSWGLSPCRVSGNPQPLCRGLSK